MDYTEYTLMQLLKERHELGQEYTEVRHKLDISSAEYHEDGITGNKYEYAEVKRDERALENDLQLLDELIDERKRQSHRFETRFYKAAKEELDDATLGFLKNEANGD